MTHNKSQSEASNRKLQAYNVSPVLESTLTDDAKKTDRSRSEAVIHGLECYYEPPEWVRTFIRQQAMLEDRPESQLMSDIMTQWAVQQGAAPPAAKDVPFSPEDTQNILETMAADPKTAQQFLKAFSEMFGKIKYALPAFGF